VVWRNPVESFQEEIVAVNGQADNYESQYANEPPRAGENSPIVLLIGYWPELAECPS
jgi:hypothetical protein